jgi:hypothetical protein
MHYFGQNFDTIFRYLNPETMEAKLQRYIEANNFTEVGFLSTTALTQENTKICPL